MTVTNIEQYYIEAHEKQKFEVLTSLLDIQTPNLRLFLDGRKNVWMKCRKVN